MIKLLLPLIILLASTLTFAQDARVISQNANLRGVPTAKGAKVTTLENASKMKIIGSDGTWYLVQTPEYIGWIYGKLIKVEGTKEPLEITLLQKAKVIGGSASLRGIASEDGMQTAVLKNNTTIEVYGKALGWYLVQTPFYAGWIRAESVREMKPRATNLPTSKTGRTIFQTENSDDNRNPMVRIRNRANKTLILTFGGIKYIIKPGRGRMLELSPGKYKYTAAGGGATPYTRIENFQKGRIYGVTFNISKRKR